MNYDFTSMLESSTLSSRWPTPTNNYNDLVELFEIWSTIADESRRNRNQVRGWVFGIYHALSTMDAPSKLVTLAGRVHSIYIWAEWPFNDVTAVTTNEESPSSQLELPLNAA